jgi:hypothetical protein
MSIMKLVLLVHLVVVSILLSFVQSKIQSKRGERVVVAKVVVAKCRMFINNCQNNHDCPEDQYCNKYWIFPG